MSFFGDGIDPGAFDAALESSRSRFADAGTLPGMRGWRRAYGAPGGVRALAELADTLLAPAPALDPGRLYALRRAAIEDGGLARVAAQWPQPGRAVQVAAALAMLVALVEELGIDQLVPVQAGLRAGVIRALHERSREGASDAASGKTAYRDCV